MRTPEPDHTISESELPDAPQAESALAGFVGGSAVDMVSTLLGGPPFALVGYGLTVAVEILYLRRVRKGCHLLIEEFRSGGRGLEVLVEHASEEVAAVTIRYLRAATERATRINLRLLARTIAGQVEEGQVQAAEFLEWSDMLASLSRSEIILLAELHRRYEEAGITDDHSNLLEGQINKACRDFMLDKGIVSDTRSLEALYAKLTRTGLIIPTSLASGIGYDPSPLLRKVALMADLENALLKEQGPNPA